MPAKITVDSTDEIARVYWIDDKGDTDAPAPPGANVTFSSGDESVATVDPQTGKVAPVGEGQAPISADITGPDGGPLMEPDGVTPFSVQPDIVTVGPGEAVGAGLELKSSDS